MSTLPSILIMVVYCLSRGKKSAVCFGRPLEKKTIPGYDPLSSVTLSQHVLSKHRK